MYLSYLHVVNSQRLWLVAFLLPSAKWVHCDKTAILWEHLQHNHKITGIHASSKTLFLFCAQPLTTEMGQLQAFWSPFRLHRFFPNRAMALQIKLYVYFGSSQSCICPTHSSRCVHIQQSKIITNYCLSVVIHFIKQMMLCVLAEGHIYSQAQQLSKNRIYYFLPSFARI